MDLLGSILNKMEKPPVIKKNEKEQELIKKQQEKLKQAEQAEKDKLKQFKQTVENRLKQMIDSEMDVKVQFEPMDHFFRTVVHGVAEDLELRSISFGFEGTDRHVVVYKPDHFPCDDEISCLKRGESYDPDKVKKRKEAEEAERQQQSGSKSNKKQMEIANNYQDKYKHLIGNEAGKSAAQVATPNSSFGVVPSSNKRDSRSIEQTLADIRKKKQKTVQDEEENEVADFEEVGDSTEADQQEGEEEESTNAEADEGDEAETSEAEVKSSEIFNQNQNNQDQPDSTTN